MIKIKSRQNLFWLISAALLLIVIAIGPIDLFTHGYYYDEINMAEATEDMDIPIDLSKRDYEMHFSPVKKHLIGIEVLLKNNPPGNYGTIVMAIKEENGKILDLIDIDLSRVKDNVWYKTYVTAKLKAGRRYVLTFSAKDCGTVPSLVTIDRDYLGEETLDGNVALSYAYKKSTFIPQTKVLIILFIISLWLWVASKQFDKIDKKRMQKVSFFVLMISILTWNYMYNSMDNANVGFGNFQEDSETLVASVIKAEEDHVWFSKADEFGFGLGRYYSNLGGYVSYELSPITDNNWNKGYSKTEAAIIIDSNKYTKEILGDLSFVGFSNDNIIPVVEVVDDGTNIVIRLESDRLLNSEKYGEIQDIVFINSQMSEYKPAALIAYKSQYGLQGKIFRYLARYIADDAEIADLNLLCSLSTAIVFSVIVLLLATKYNSLLAGITFLTFWLSPWVVNFARNLYWVEFTWFLPMAIGLFCAWRIDDRGCRIFSYIAAFIAIAGRCLCGYEYLSSIMMGLISFLLVDFITSIARWDKAKAKLLFRTIIIIGITALLGFAVAICIHASLRTEGHLLTGIKNIFEQDILRRTSGGNLNDFEPVYWESFNASAWEVCCKYFKFSTEIVTGVNGNLFPFLCCVPLSIFIYEFYRKKLDIEIVALYVIFFMTAISWFCLAKSHSYIHVHMNYVTWYFGFVQTCFYVIVNKVVGIYKNLRKDIK